jgi:hypothetical protein
MVAGFVPSGIVMRAAVASSGWRFCWRALSISGAIWSPRLIRQAWSNNVPGLQHRGVHDRHLRSNPSMR